MAGTSYFAVTGRQKKCLKACPGTLSTGSTSLRTSGSQGVPQATNHNIWIDYMTGLIMCSSTSVGSVDVTTLETSRLQQLNLLLRQ